MVTPMRYRDTAIRELLVAVVGLTNLVHSLHKEIKTMSTVISANLLALQAQVAQNTSIEQSAVALINGIAAQLAAAIAADANGDDAALPALQASLASSSTALSAAITANTPAAPAAS
jgi:hypothetical protein